MSIPRKNQTNPEIAKLGQVEEKNLVETGFSKLGLNEDSNDDEFVSDNFSTSTQICQDCPDKDILIEVLREMLATRDNIICNFRKELNDNDRLIKLLRHQKQILTNKNAELRSGEVPNTVKNRIVENTLRGKHLYKTSDFILWSFFWLLYA